MLGMACTVRTLVTPCLDTVFGATHLLLCILTLCMLTGRDDLAALVCAAIYQYLEIKGIQRLPGLQGGLYQNLES
jgi:hypothetical protein